MWQRGGEILRWSVILAAGGYGVWRLVGAGYDVLTRWNGDWLDAFSRCVFPVVLASISLAVALIFLRRQYGQLFTIVSALGGLAVFLVFMSLPGLLGINEFMHQQVRNNPNLVFIALPVSLICLFGPIYATGAFLRFCEWLWHRRFHGIDRNVEEMAPADERAGGSADGMDAVRGGCPPLQDALNRAELPSGIGVLVDASERPCLRGRVFFAVVRTHCRNGRETRSRHCGPPGCFVRPPAAALVYSNAPGGSGRRHERSHSDDSRRLPEVARRTR